MCVCVCVFLLRFQCYILCPCKVAWWEGHREFAWVWEGGLCTESTVAHIFKIVTLLTSHFKLCAHTNPIQGHCWSTSRRVWQPWIEVRILLVLRTEDETLLFSLSNKPPQSQWDSVSSDPANRSIMSVSIGWPMTGYSSAYLTLLHKLIFIQVFWLCWDWIDVL